MLCECVYAYLCMHILGPSCACMFVCMSVYSCLCNTRLHGLPYMVVPLTF